MDYQFWLNTTLALVTISLAILAIGLAMAGVWGYRSIKTEAARLAREEAGRAVDNLVNAGGLRQLVDRRVKEEGTQVFDEIMDQQGLPIGRPRTSESDEAES